MGIKAINLESTLRYLGQELLALLFGKCFAGPGRLPSVPAYLECRPSAKATSLQQKRDAETEKIGVCPAAAVFSPDQRRSAWGNGCR